jgi:tRNA modification GTPase
MINKLSGWGDTIVAIATAPGIGAIATIRLSGAESFGIIDRLFPSKKISDQKTHTLHVGILESQGKALDEVVIALFKGPKSYTGEDIIEISCHGSIFIQQQILSACIEEGARLARPGEFTQRAFLNGRMDLTQAEAVADLIASNTRASQKNALNNIRGGFSGQLKEMRDQLIQFAALIELELDFATEDVEFADRTKFYELIRHIDSTTTYLLNSFQLGNVIKNGISVAIIGKPNAGKSTLLNTLLNDNRAIVSEIAGTTRDTIEEVMNIQGILFRLIDTAGIRSHSSDVIENIGIEKSLEKMKSADVVLYIFDAKEEHREELQQQISIFQETGINYLLVANKSDMDSISPLELPGEKIYPISAKNKTNIDQLTNALFDITVKGTLEEDSNVVTNIRHFEALQKVKTTVTDIINGLDQQLSGDLLALEIRSCLYYLGEITGEITNEDKLDFIFSKFCIGK